MSDTTGSILEIVFAEDQFQTFKAGQVIFSENTDGDCMYLVRAGAVALTVKGKPLAELTIGDTLGELAIVDDERRAATAVAVTDCEMIPIDKARFLELVQRTPYFALDVMRVMAQRLRTMNKLLAER